jgi:uncharacterized membrane protein YkvA (DUF1232 family)
MPNTNKTFIKPNWLFVIQLLKNQKTRWIAIILVALYIISPIDIIPDFIPIFGLFDDGILLSAIIMIFRKINSIRK